MAMASHRRIGRRFLTAAICAAATLAGCERASAPSRPNVPADVVKQAYAHFTDGRYEEAAAGFERIVQARPEAFDVRRDWAYALAALGRFDEVDEVLRSTPVAAEPNRAGGRPTPDQDGPTPDPQAATMLWRRAFNVYRYYYYANSPSPDGVFRAGAIRDALEVLELGDLQLSELSTPSTLPLRDLHDLLRLWTCWDRVARDADLFPHRRWCPVLKVAEPERLRDHLDQLTALEQQGTGAVWLHPDDQGNWLAHPGAIDADAWPPDNAAPAGRVADELTETVRPSSGLAEAWTVLARWLRRNVPHPAVFVVAGICPERDQPFDRRLVLGGRLEGDRFRIEGIGVTGPASALLAGYAEYGRLRRAAQVTASSSVEVESLAGAYTSAGLSTTAFNVDQAGHVFADDPLHLACLLSYVRYGAALFGQPVVMSASPVP